MKKSYKIMSVITVIALCMSFFTIGASAESTLKSDLSNLAEEYGFNIDYIQPDYSVISKSSTDYLPPVAHFDTVAEFEEALKNGEFAFLNMAEVPLPIEDSDSAVASDVSPIAVMASGSRNRTLTEITTGLDLCATISYTFTTKNSRTYYTAFTNFVPYFSGLNIGYSFDLTTWSGTVCSSIDYRDNRWYYTPADSGEGYYITWGGNLKWGVEVGGTLVGMSDYIGSWFIGMGDFGDK